MLIIKCYGSVIKFALCEPHQEFIAKIKSNSPQLFNVVVFGEITLLAGKMFTVVCLGCLRNSRINVYICMFGFG